MNETGDASREPHCPSNQAAEVRSPSLRWPIPYGATVLPGHLLRKILPRATFPELLFCRSWTPQWILDFTRVNLALRNPDNETSNLQTLFELRPDKPLASETSAPLGRGIVGKMIRVAKHAIVSALGFSRLPTNAFSSSPMSGPAMQGIPAQSRNACYSRM